ncbi:MAG: hypothetical protein K8I30_05425 [Anaerolineae bacterium]|nr:hypothetical protein [Anaerolineae bacterium]
MDISWVYLILTGIVLWLGLDILIHKRGGLHKWQQPFGYRVVYYRGKPARIVGMVMTLFGLIFMMDAIRVLLFGNIIPGLAYTFCFGSMLLMAGVNIFARKYAE